MLTFVETIRERLALINLDDVFNIKAADPALTP
jgi:hypothetical protein